MTILEFENTQGINLQYVAASSTERALAWALDVVFMFLAILLLAVFSPGGGDFIVLVITLLVAVFYTPMFEVFNDGRSPGKMIVGLKVIRVDGRPVRAYDYLMRWMFRWIDIYATSGALAFLMVSATPRSQRIGDILADTTVINTRQGRIALKRILKLSQLKKYTPKYPQVAQLSEEQLLLVKKVSERSRKINNPTHKALRKEMADRLRVELDIQTEVDDRKFLDTIIKDYIALTR